MSSKFLIAGLGNIGAEYDQTRHNIGFEVLDYLASKYELTFQTERYALVARLKHKGKELILIKPTTYMNLSGKAVHYWLQKEKIPLSNLIVITDDIALPLGKLRLRGQGSDGGHNGLKNIQELLQTKNYTRLRLGIGNDFPKGKQAEYVLGKWKNEEKEIIKSVIEKAADAVISFTLIGLEKTMNMVNSK
ncbi:MAG: aminoacyl-tRNA hydrolase [Flavobacteriales bacterium]|nr:aminoacyl-tRNA hydrolase [Flavobacteriales bacterium]